MSNKKRICEANLTYHVYSRCVQGLNLLTDYWKKELEDIVVKAMAKYDFECNGSTILENHFHFIIRTKPGGGSISSIMQYIKSIFARKYNRQTGRMGPVWNERFGDKIIEHQDNMFGYFIRLLAYIEYNAIKKRYVAVPFVYSFCNIGEYVNKPSNSIIPVTKSYIKSLIHDSFEEIFYRDLELLQN